MRTPDLYLKSLAGVLFYNTMLDFLDPEIQIQQILVFLQYVVMSVPLFLIRKKIRLKYYFLTLFLFLGYLAVISLGSSEMLITFNHYFKVFFSSLYLIAGYYIINSEYDLKILVNCLLVLMTLFVGYIALSNLLSIGEFLYTDSGIVRTGYLSGARLYPYSLIVLLVLIIPVLFRDEKIKVYTFYVLAIISVILIIVITRRTAILILVVGLSLFVILKPNLGNIIKIVTFLVVVFGIALLNLDSIRMAYEIRAERVTNIQLLTTERRYQEYEAIYRTLEQEPVSVIFGTGELFNNRGDYGQFHWRNWDDRRIHSDYGILLHGGGLLALFLYLIFLFSLFKKAFSLSPQLRYFKDMKVVLISLLIIATIISFAGGIYYVSYHTTIMLLAGSFIRLIENEEITL